MSSALHDWAQQQLLIRPHITYPPPLTLAPLPGDAGLRRYYRLNTQPPLLAVTAPRDAGTSECAEHFSRLAAVLREQGVPAPKVVACDTTHNRLLLEDFGPMAFLDCLSEDSVETLYSEALMALSRLQQIPRSALQVPDYDADTLMAEMQLFQHWFVAQLLAYTPSAAEEALMARTWDCLLAQALEQPQVLVHRDYHSRNLLYREGEAPGIIDFQDARWGPITYDLVSLLRDCYVHWRPEQVDRWRLAYGNLAIELGLMPEVAPARWQQWFDAMGLQRHIKVLGVFARLHLRDGKSRYLQDLPLVWHYVTQVAQAYSPTADFARWCDEALRPRVEQQAWFRPIDMESVA